LSITFRPLTRNSYYLYQFVPVLFPVQCPYHYIHKSVTGFHLSNARSGKFTVKLGKMSGQIVLIGYFVHYVQNTLSIHWVFFTLCIDRVYIGYPMYILHRGPCVPYVVHRAPRQAEDFAAQCWSSLFLNILVVVASKFIIVNCSTDWLPCWRKTSVLKQAIWPILLNADFISQRVDRPLLAAYC